MKNTLKTGNVPTKKQASKIVLKIQKQKSKIFRKTIDIIIKHISDLWSYCLIRRRRKITQHQNPSPDYSARTTRDAANEPTTYFKHWSGCMNPVSTTNSFSFILHAHTIRSNAGRSRKPIRYSSLKNNTDLYAAEQLLSETIRRGLFHVSVCRHRVQQVCPTNAITFNQFDFFSRIFNFLYFRTKNAIVYDTVLLNRVLF